MTRLVVVARTLAAAERLAARHALPEDGWVWAANVDVALEWGRRAGACGVPLRIWEPGEATPRPVPDAPPAVVRPEAVVPAAAEPSAPVVMVAAAGRVPLHERLAARRAGRGVATCS